MSAKSFIRIALIATGCCAGEAAFAQACTTFDGTASMSGTILSGNTCGKNLGLTSICGGGDPTNGAGTSVFQIHAGPAPQNFGFQVISTTAGFNPELAFTIDTCSSLSACQIDDTNNTQTVPSVGIDTPTTLPAPNSTSFVFVSDLNPEAPGCGDFNLVVGGAFNDPVLLQDFSVD